MAAPLDPFGKTYRRGVSAPLGRLAALREHGTCADDRPPAWGTPVLKAQRFRRTGDGPGLCPRKTWEQLSFPSEFLHIPMGQSRDQLYRSELI